VNLGLLVQRVEVPGSELTLIFRRCGFGEMYHIHESILEISNGIYRSRHTLQGTNFEEALETLDAVELSLV
jgi:hypothetical protein